MTNESTRAAQPTFSDEEFEALFHRLGIQGDHRNEADRARLIQLLRDIVEDPDFASDRVAAVYVDHLSNPDKRTLAIDGPFEPIRRRLEHSVDPSILADRPSVGRDLSEAAAEWAHLRASADASVADGGIVRGYALQLESPDSARSPEKTFIVNASRALPSRQPSTFRRLLARLVDA